ncbi:DPP IV N-terminal domain-containing protein [Fulvivirgaceae bacterium PWU4]|uniref:DPP IV N-terminal domain-containing protein n=1 Tax=Chryseosolibacter histidini TaxID=2782349 RepID=A0AAP2GHG0_9BACT|nr:DPP IV N-terminal domain-containing protein [Chryseosolibacter histidini]
MLLTIVLILPFHFLFSQQESGGIVNANEFADVFSGPVPKWRPRGDGYAFIARSGLVIKVNDSTRVIQEAQNTFTWSHDGESIVYTAKDSSGILKIFRYFLNDGTSKLLSLESGWADFYPDISPDDSIVAYYSAKGEPYKLYYLKNGVTRKLLARDPLEEYLHPKWSPGSNYLVYFKHLPTDEVILEIMEFFSKRVVFSLDGNRFDFYAWSPDGKEILAREVVETTVYPDYNNVVLVRFNIETGNKTVLTRKLKDLSSAEWSKASNRIVFVANEELYVMEENGANLKKIFSGGHAPNIHPNGKKVIFFRNRKNLPVCEIDLTGDNLKTLERKTFKISDLEE